MKKLLMLLVLAPLMALADTWKDPNTGIWWTYTVNGGTALVGGWSSTTRAISNTTTGEIVIPSTLGGCPVTRIGNYAFSGCSGLTSVTIPEGVTRIDDYAFYKCSGLTSVSMPLSVTSIGSYAFSGCSGLTSVTIPSSVTSIGRDAFSGCSGLKSVTIPSSVTSIAERSFDGCSGLTSVTIPPSVTSIGYDAFYGCSGLTSVTIPSSVTSIGDWAFSGCSGLTSVTISEGVTSIGSYAFENCSGLESVTIPSSVTSIGDWAFYNCNAIKNVVVPAWKCGIDFSTVTNLVISEGTTSVGNSVFSGCSGLKTVTIPSSVIYVGNFAFEGCSGLTSAMIVEGVTSIGNYVFRDCSGLETVTIPSSVTIIGNGAFSGCGRLSTVIVGIGDADRIKGLMIAGGNDVSNLTFFEMLSDGGPYEKTVDGIEWTFIVSDGKAQVGGGSEESLAIPTTTEGPITIPSTFGGCQVTRIGDYAFYNCSGLTSVTIPSSVRSIGWGAFYGCSGLKKIHVGGDGDIDAVKRMLSESGFDFTNVNFDNGGTRLSPAKIAGIAVGSAVVAGVGGYFIGRAASEAIGKKKGNPTYKQFKAMKLVVPELDSNPNVIYKNKLIYHPAKGTVTGRVVLTVQKGDRTQKIRAKAKGSLKDGVITGTLDAKGLGTFDFTVK